MQGDAADPLIARVLAAHAAGGPLGPDAVTLLARAWTESGRADIGEATGLEVARVLQAVAGPRSWRPIPTEGRSDEASERAAWLALLVDVASLSDDARLAPAIEQISSAIAAGWPGSDRLGAAMRGVDACLRAALVLQPSIARAAVDELERLVACAYRPGRGVLARCGEAEPGGLEDHVQAAAAFVTAYRVAGRLPYAMLADDLMQFARRSWWTDLAEPATLTEVAGLCGAARVLGRLAAIHADPQYAKAAIVREGYEHVADAERLLSATAPAAARFGVAACIHALAAREVEEIRN